jgi:tRNA uridine 5-carbamoylmethylation protein Kti12
MQELRLRFEAPDERNRWDQPLFRVNATPSAQSECLKSAEDKDASSTQPVENENKTDIHSKLKSSSNVETPPHTTSTTTTAPAKSSFTKVKKSNNNSSGNPNTTSSEISPQGVSNSLVSLSLTSSNMQMLNQTLQVDENANNTPTSHVNTTTATDPDSKGVYFSGTMSQKNSVITGLTPDVAYQQILEYFRTASRPAPNIATKGIRHADADLLYQLDTVSQEVVQKIMSHQISNHSDGSSIIFSDYKKSILLQRHVGLPELQRHKRQFVKMNSQHPPTNSVDVGAKFVDFLNNQLSA